MFIKANELNTHIYDYQLSQITESDTSLVQSAISAAIDEVKGYLSTHYDTRQIFAAEDEERNSLVLEFCKTVAVWRIVKLANVDMLYSRYRELYLDTISYLLMVSEGKLALDLPRLTDSDGQPSGGTLRINSNKKFNHYI